MTEELQDVICPACGEKMVQVFMPQQGVNIDVCVNGCGGIYFDNRELSKFDEPHEDISPLAELFGNKEFKPADVSKVRKCPVCGADMVKNYTNEAHEVEIDECYSCGGKFLDYKELDKIRTQLKQNEPNPSDIMKRLYAQAGVDMKKFDIDAQTGSWKKGAAAGCVLGIVIDILLLYNNYDFLLSMPSDTAFTYAAALGAGICLITAGIGALYSKLRCGKCTI